MSNKRYDSAELIGSDKKSSVKQVQMNSKINRDSGRKPVTLDSKKLDYQFNMYIEDRFDPYDIDESIDLLDIKARRLAKYKKRVAQLKIVEQDSILMASPVATPSVTRNLPISIQQISSDPMAARKRDSAEKEKSIISEVDPAFEEGAGSPEKEKEFLRQSNNLIATFQNSDQITPIISETPRKGSPKRSKGSAVERLAVSKKSTSQVARKPSDRSNNLYSMKKQNLNFDIKTKIKRLQTQGRGSKPCNSPFKDSKSNSKIFDLDSVISRPKDSTFRNERGRGRTKGQPFDDRKSSFNLTVDNQLENLSINFGKGQIRNIVGSQVQNASVDKDSHLNGTFSIISNDKVNTPFIKKSDHLKGATQYEFKQHALPGKQAAKRSSTMRSKIMDSQFSDNENLRSCIASQNDQQQSSVLEIDSAGNEDALLMRDRIKNSNKQMMAVYTRNPYKVSSSDFKRGIAGSATKREQPQQKLYIAENHLKPKRKFKSPGETINSSRNKTKFPKTSSMNIYMSADGSLTGRKDSTDDEGPTELLNLLKKFEQQSNSGDIEKDLRLCLYQQVEQELQKRATLLSQQVVWLKKQKRLCKVYGQQLSNVVNSVLSSPLDSNKQVQVQSRQETLRLKNADKLKPVIRKNMDRDINSILAESVSEPKEIIDDQFDIRNMIITDSINSQAIINNHTDQSALKQLISLCQRLKFSATKIAVLKGLLRRIETSENDLNRLIQKKVTHIGRREHSGVTHQNELAAYKLTVTQLRKLMQANKLQAHQIPDVKINVNDENGWNTNDSLIDNSIFRTTLQGGSQELEEYFDTKVQTRKSLQVENVVMKQQKKKAVRKRMEENRASSHLIPDDVDMRLRTTRKKDKNLHENNFIRNNKRNILPFQTQFEKYQNISVPRPISFTNVTSPVEKFKDIAWAEQKKIDEEIGINQSYQGQKERERLINKLTKLNYSNVLGTNQDLSHSPIRSKRQSVIQEVRTSRQKLIQGGANVIGDLSGKKEVLNYQHKHKRQIYPQSFIPREPSPTSKDYAQSSLIDQKMQYQRFQQTTNSQALQNVLNQQRQLDRGLRGVGSMRTQQRHRKNYSYTTNNNQEFLASSQSQTRGTLADRIHAIASQQATRMQQIQAGSSIISNRDVRNQRGSIPESIRVLEPQQ